MMAENLTKRSSFLAFSRASLDGLLVMGAEASRPWKKLFSLQGLETGEVVSVSIVGCFNDD